MTQFSQFNEQARTDADHLNLLAMFHFVGAGFALLGTLAVLGHYAFVRTMFMDPLQELPQAEHLGGMFAILKWGYLALFIWFISLAVLNVLSGLFLRARKHRSFSLFVAGINCLHIPLGTVLGVFTSVVLLRSSVWDLYEAQTRDPLDLQGQQSPQAINLKE